MLRGWFPQDDSLTARNGLLVSQQLDQLFRKIDDGVAEDESRLASYVGLLEVFYVFDRRFVEQNEGSNIATVETANAAQRLGLCAKVFGDLELSKSHYLKARESLDEAIGEEPKSVALLQNLLEVQTTIAELEQASGNSDAGRQAFNSALVLLAQSNVEASPETSEWIAPLYKAMATLAVQMELYPQARALADQYVQSMQSLATHYSNDEQWREKADEARSWFEQINERIATVES
jgi:tetratricopeptide (TPR) repeat protein